MILFYIQLSNVRNYTIGAKKIQNLYNIQTNKLNNLLNVLDATGLYNPVFCYHPSLGIAGNCRMCLVEVANRPKPIVACTALYENNLYTNIYSSYTKKAQEHVLEFLLLNHPLDCPICDQGGECDLQDNALKFGGLKSRFTQKKHSTVNFFISPLIQTVFTRCIHCTRCVRFVNEISSESFLGMLGRSVHSGISTYTTKAQECSSLTSNIAALCPVGKLYIIS